MIKSRLMNYVPKLKNERVSFMVRDCGYMDWSFKVEFVEVEITESIEREMRILGLFDAYMAGNVHPCVPLVWSGHTDYDYDLGMAKGGLVYCDGVEPSRANWDAFEGKHQLYRESILDGWETLSNMLKGFGAERVSLWIDSEILDKA